MLRNRADDLFLRRCEEIAQLERYGRDETAIFDIAGKLRQLFFDEKSLIDQVNATGIDLAFTVGKFDIDLAAFPALQAVGIGDAIDPRSVPEPGVDGFPARGLAGYGGEMVINRQEFGSYVVMYLNRNPITLKTVVRYGANVAGGVHLDPRNSRPEHQDIKLLEDSFFIGGLSVGSLPLRGIARVALRGLEPLTNEVKKRRQ